MLKVDERVPELVHSGRAVLTSIPAGSATLAASAPGERMTLDLAASSRTGRRAALDGRRVLPGG